MILDSAQEPKREDIPTISMDEFSGQRVFFYFSDWTRVGTYKGLDGNLNISLQGGPDYAQTKKNLDNDAGWAFTDEKAWTNFNNKVNDSTDGVGLIALLKRDNLRGNPTFLKAYIAEVKNAIKKGRLTGA